MESLIGSIVFLIAALVLFFFAWESFRLLIEAITLKSSRIKDLPLDTLVKISGKASTEALLKAPATDIESIFYTYAIERETLSSNSGKGGSRYTWNLAWADESIPAFEVSDETGVVKVIPEGASVDLRKIVDGLRATPEYLEENGLMTIDNERWKKAPHRISVYAVLPGDRLFVIGTTKKVGDQVVIHRSEGGYLYFSTHSELRIFALRVFYFVLLLLSGLVSLGASIIFYMND